MMKQVFVWLLAGLIGLSPASARAPGSSAPDPGSVWFQLPQGLNPNTDLTGKTERGVNIGSKLLVLISIGQSLAANSCPTNYTPTNPTALDNLDPTTGRIYAAADPLLGTTMNGGGVGTANWNLRLADNFVTAGKFNRVLIVTVAVAATAINQWSGSNTYAPLSRTIQSVALKLAARGLTPSTPNVTFLVTWNQGESDTAAGTLQAAYLASLGLLKTSVDPFLPGVRWVVSVETWYTGSVNSGVQAAQAAFVNNVTVFAGGNFDSMNASFRNGDNTHLNASGCIQAAGLQYNAIVATGAPF